MKLVLMKVSSAGCFRRLNGGTFYKRDIGGIIIDEMTIQSDIHICKNGDVTELSGLINLGEEGNLAHELRQGTAGK